MQNESPMRTHDREGGLREGSLTGAMLSVVEQALMYLGNGTLW